MLEGKEICSHCTGYGSSLNDPVGVDVCTVCGGSGLIETKDVKDERSTRSSTGV
jgi:DnaJ-class molecular chaperone